MSKTVVELDLEAYSGLALELEQQLSAEAVMQFNDQLQGFVDAGLKSVETTRGQAVMATTGDGAILVFDKPDIAHRFAEAVHQNCLLHNQSKTVAAARRWFRTGIATGDLAIEVIEGSRKIAGSVITRAVRLESAAAIGEIVADADTFAVFSKEVQIRYGSSEVIPGKREEQFTAHRCRVVPFSVMLEKRQHIGQGVDLPKPNYSKAVTILREKIAYLEERRAITDSATQKFELLWVIREAKQQLQELLK